MKRKISFLCCYLIGIVLAVITITLSSCDRFTTKKSSTSVDSTYVAEEIQAIVNPSFTSVEELLVFRQMELDEYSIDEKFCSMPVNTLTSVATVCLNKFGEINKRCVVEEYITHQDVYDNLKNSTTPTDTIISPPTENKTVVEEVTPPDDKDKYIREEKDTVINGRKATITEYKKLAQ